MENGPVDLLFRSNQNDSLSKCSMPSPTLKPCFFKRQAVKITLKNHYLMVTRFNSPYTNFPSIQEKLHDQIALRFYFFHKV